VLPDRDAADSGKACENCGDFRPSTSDKDKSPERLLFESSAISRKSIFMGRFIFFPGEEIWHNHLRSRFHNQSPLGCHL
jgi:hypothetical protein